MRTIIIFIAAIWLFSGCTKEFLDKKPSSSLTVPQTLSDYEELLDNPSLYMYQPALLTVGSDEFYINESTWSSLSLIYRKAYTWEKDILEGNADNNWTSPYLQIFYANVIIDGINGLSVTDQERKNIDLGRAHYFRAKGFYNLSQLYCKPYAPATANKEPGIVLRTTSDLNVPSKRSTIQETYDQIIKELQFAAANMPQKKDNIKRNRPFKASAYGLLARVGIVMNDYDFAFENSNTCIGMYDTLLDYAKLDTNKLRPLLAANPEVLNDEFAQLAFSWNQNYMIDSVLYNSYQKDDLRKAVYFQIGTNKKPYFTGQLTGISTPTYSPTTSEMYLIRAECQARKGNTTNALADLNRLLQNRFVPGKYIPYNITDKNLLVDTILAERRRELVLRGLRWPDLRRLNLNSATGTTLYRFINGQQFTLLPNDTRYVYQIPNNEISQSGIEQNIR